MHVSAAVGFGGVAVLISMGEGAEVEPRPFDQLETVHHVGRDGDDRSGHSALDSQLIQPMPEQRPLIVLELDAVSTDQGFEAIDVPKPPGQVRVVVMVMGVGFDDRSFVEQRVRATKEFEPYNVFHKLFPAYEIVKL